MKFEKLLALTHLDNSLDDILLYKLFSFKLSKLYILVETQDCASAPPSILTRPSLSNYFFLI